jgi:hypothetical protein
VKRAALTPRQETSGREKAAGARSASFVRETRFALAPHVFACVDGSHVVLLDLKHDEYYALDIAVTQGLAVLVAGWPIGGSQAADAIEPAKQAVAADALLVVDALLLHELLVSPPRTGKRMDHPRVRPAESDLRTGPACLMRVNICDFVQVARAALVAALLLRCCSLERLVRRTLARKRRSATKLASKSAGRAASAAQHARLVDRLGRFDRLRPLFFSARDACLLESLALLEFLAGHDLHPDWVFGVRTRPFAAHCWVQYGDAVCNDVVERVCRFTPILVA